MENVVIHSSLNGCREISQKDWT